MSQAQWQVDEKFEDLVLVVAQAHSGRAGAQNAQVNEWRKQRGRA
jgi:hypothetical protein